MRSMPSELIGLLSDGDGDVVGAGCVGCAVVLVVGLPRPGAVVGCKASRFNG